jgi:hypothetical protein
MQREPRDCRDLEHRCDHLGLHNGFDVPNSDGTQGDGLFSDLALCASEQAQTLDDTFLDLFALPSVRAAFDTLLIARAANGASFRTSVRLSIAYMCDWSAWLQTAAKSRALGHQSHRMLCWP